MYVANSAIGNGANPAQGGTPGGGSGGVIYNDGNTFTLTLIESSLHAWKRRLSPPDPCKASPLALTRLLC